MSVHLQYLPHLQCQQLGTLALGRRYTKSSINHTRSYNMQRMRSSMLSRCCRRNEAGALLRTHVDYEPGDQMGWWTHYLQSWNLIYFCRAPLLTGCSLLQGQAKICTQWAETNAARFPKWHKARSNYFICGLIHTTGSTWIFVCGKNTEIACDAIG